MRYRAKFIDQLPLSLGDLNCFPFMVGRFALFALPCFHSIFKSIYIGGIVYFIIYLLSNFPSTGYSKTVRGGDSWNPFDEYFQFQTRLPHSLRANILTSDSRKSAESIDSLGWNWTRNFLACLLAL